MTPKHPPGPPMDLANMRRQGVLRMICLQPDLAQCAHRAKHFAFGVAFSIIAKYISTYALV